MATEYCRRMLRICIAQLCQNLGWNATQSSPLELLTDVLERYLIDLGKISHRYSEQFGRTEPNLDDLALTFRHYGIQLGELEDYIRHVEPVAFAREVVSFPARKRNNLGFPNPRSRELLQHREEHVHDHLPYMYPGMEDEVEEEPSLPTPCQLPQESVSPLAVSPTPTDKRPLSNSAEGPPPKRPRLTNLPEEAGHSQYEMKSVLMNPSGVLTPTRQGKLPDARTPPTFRQALQFKEDKEKGRENKDQLPKLADKRDDQDGGADHLDKSNNCMEKVAPKKKMLKQYKQMAADDATSGMPRSPKVGKLARPPKQVSPLVTKNTKPKNKMKSKDKNVKKSDNSVAPSGGIQGESCLKDLLLSSKLDLHKGEKAGLTSPKLSSPKTKSDSKHKHKDKKAKVVVDKPLRVDPEAQLKQQPVSAEGAQSRPETTSTSRLGPSLEEELSSNSRDDSPQRLVIAEGDVRVKNTKEARLARLALIDDSIESVIRDSQAHKDKTDTFTFSEEVSVDMSPKVVKGKKKDKVKSGKDSDKQKKKEKKEKSDSQSIDESIDSVIRQSSEEVESVSGVSASVEDVVKRVVMEELPPSVRDVPPPVLIQEQSNKKVKEKAEKKPKKKVGKKDKLGSAKDKLKDKLKVKTEKLDLFQPDKKPSVLDKFSAKEYSVYDFPESPPSLLPPQPKKATPKSGTSPKRAQHTPAAAPPTPVSLPPAPPPPAPPVVPPAPPAAPPASREEPQLPPDDDQPPLMTLKIDLKHKQKDKEKSKVTKDKDHKKEKKEKKKDKEKKKKNKDKDKEKSRDKRKEERHKEEKEASGSVPPGGPVAPIKLNIKFGGLSAATSTVVTETKITSPKTETVLASPKTPRPEPLLSPKRDIPRLVIKPIRRESLEAKAKLGAASRSPAIMSPAKPPTPPPQVPPKASSPSPPTPPPPKIKSPPRSPSPPVSPPKPKTPPPKSPTPSPPPPPSPSPPPPQIPKSPTPPVPSPSPPPRSPTPEKLLTPSPEPKLRSPLSSPIRKSPTPLSCSPSPKSPPSHQQFPLPPRTPSPSHVHSVKSSPQHSPSSPHLQMDIDSEPEKDPEPEPKPKPVKSSPKVKAETKPSPKGKRGRKPKEENAGETRTAAKSRTKSVPSVTSETVSETPITGPIVQRTVVAETIGSFIDADGNKVWICPSCKMQDDGSPMIGCDTCDDWYHWTCMNITEEPKEDEWYCPRCQEIRARAPKGGKPKDGKPKGKKRGRKKKT